MKVETSIIIPCYNVGPFIGKLILQLEKQTYQNFEVIFINDGSTDQTGEAIEKNIAQINHFRVVSIENSGAGAARNIGLDHASGQYIYFMDADDQINPNLLECSIAQIKRDKSEILIFGYEAINNNKVVYSGSYSSEKVFKSHNDFFLYINENFYKNNLFCPWNKIYRKEFLDKLNMRFPNVKSSEDALFNLTIFQFVHRVSISDQILYRYLVGREGSLQNSVSNTKFFDDYIVALKIQELVEYDTLRPIIYRQYLIHMLYRYTNKTSLPTIEASIDLNDILSIKNAKGLALKELIKWSIVRMRRVYLR